MKIALIADELTSGALALESQIQIQHVTPQNYDSILKAFKPDFLLVESAWHGYQQHWKYKIANYPTSFWRSNRALKKVVRFAKDLGLPTVFWSKEDDVHFDRFIKSALLFDHIFTVDINSVPKYQALVDSEVTVDTLMFAVQPKIHYFSGFNFQYNKANFIGSYSHHVHLKRKAWQDMLFQSACSTGLDMVVYDRNSNHKSSTYRYPELSGIEIRAAIPYEQTGQVYKDYLVSLNVNTIEDSSTMFSRRLIEILACGGIAVTNPTLAVEQHFKDYCHSVANEKEAKELFNRLKHGPSSDDLEMARAGAVLMAKEYVWEQRLTDIYTTLF